MKIIVSAPSAVVGKTIAGMQGYLGNAIHSIHRKNDSKYTESSMHRETEKNKCMIHRHNKKVLKIVKNMISSP